MRKVFFRYLGYALFVMTITTGMLAIARHTQGGLRFDYLPLATGVRTSEFSAVELTQNLLLIFSGGLFVWVAVRDRLRRPMAVGFVALFGLCLIRELDYFLDFYVIDNLWQVLGGLLLSAVLVYIARNLDRFVQGWRRSWPSAGLAIIIGGFILLLPYAQLIGHGPLWHDIMGDSYDRVFKVIVEEFMELGAYMLITVGSIEFLYAWSRLPRTRNLHKRRRRALG